MIAKSLNKLRYRLFGGLIPEGKIGVKLMGHRFYVGGKWEQIGQLQFDFIVQQGLQPSDCFLDVGCGALRGGKHFIQYLDKGNYLGIDREVELVKRGIEKELGVEFVIEKRPEFVISNVFEFNKFNKVPQFSLALSLFTHLIPNEIEVCLSNLRSFVNEGHMFFATFFEGDSSKNQSESHSLDHFEYSRSELMLIGEKHSWKPHYVGSWNHPREQMMMRYTAV